MKENRSLFVSAAAVAVSIAAITISIIAVYRVEPFTIDESSLSWAIGISIAVLSIGIAVMMGTQIFYIFGVEKRVDEKMILMESKSKGIADARILEYDNTVKAYLKIVSTISTELSNGDYKGAILGFTKALEIVNCGNDKSPISDIVTYIHMAVLNAKANGVIIRLHEDEERRIISAIAKSGSGEVESLIYLMRDVNGDKG